MGLMENPHGFQSWILSGPELACLLKEFKADIAKESEKSVHHDEGPTFQENFKTQAAALITSIKSLGIPFLEAGSQHLTWTVVMFFLIKL